MVSCKMIKVNLTQNYYSSKMYYYINSVEKCPKIYLLRYELLYGISQVTKKNYYMGYKVYAYVQGPNTYVNISTKFKRMFGLNSKSVKL